MADVLDCNIVISEFELQLHYYVQFLSNILKKGMNSIIIPVILFTNPSARARYDTRSIFKRSLTGFNSEFSFS